MDTRNHALCYNRKTSGANVSSSCSSCCHFFNLFSFLHTCLVYTHLSHTQSKLILRLNALFNDSSISISGKVILHTTAGDIEIELWGKETPKTCRNFIQLCMEGYYDNTIFHRIVPGFIVQGGDPTGTGQGNSSISHLCVH